MASCASHSHHFEAAPVCAHDVVNYLPHHFVLYHPTPLLHVPVPPELTEVEEEFHQPELHQQVRNFMAARIYLPPYVLILTMNESDISCSNITPSAQLPFVTIVLLYQNVVLPRLEIGDETTLLGDMRGGFLRLSFPPF